MAHAVVVGGGPVGLWTALQIKKRQPKWDIHIYERYMQYQRSHVLRLDHWSLLLYSHATQDRREKQFINEITGKSLSQIVLKVADSIYIRTNDLESALKSYVLDQGIQIYNDKVTSPTELMNKYPKCSLFIAADGAHSSMRSALLGDHSLEEKPLQYIVEVKYQVKGAANKHNLLKTNSHLNNMAFEYVGKEKNGISPVTLRFFLSKEDYDTLPEASFKSPLSLSFLDQKEDGSKIPTKLQADIQTYINLRAAAGEVYCKDSGKLTKLMLSLYSAKEFAIKKGNQAWFLVGDAAMGVPYFRALNSGLILGSRLGQILTADNWPISNDIDKKILFYKIHRPLHITTEFTIAKSKNFALDFYDNLRKVMVIENDMPEKDNAQYLSQHAFSCNTEPEITGLSHNKNLKINHK